MSPFWKKGAEKPTRHGDPDEAIARYLDQLHQADVAGASPPASALNGLGDAYLDKGDVASAVDYYRQAAETYAREGMHTNAIACLKKVRRHAADEGDLGLLLGRYYAAKKLVPDALSELDAFTRRQEKRGNRKRAIEALEEAVRLVPGDAERRERLGDLLRDEGRTEAAVGAYREALRIREEEGDAEAAAHLRERLEDAGGQAASASAAPGPETADEQGEEAGPEAAARESPAPPPEVQPDESDLAPRPAGTPNAAEVADVEPDVEVDPEPEGEAGPEPERESPPEAGPGIEPEREPELEPEPEPEPEPERPPSAAGPPAAESPATEAPPPAEAPTEELDLGLEIERTSYRDQEEEAIRRVAEDEDQKLTIAQQTSTPEGPVERAEIQGSSVEEGLEEAEDDGSEAGPPPGAGEPAPEEEGETEPEAIELDGSAPLADATAELEKAAQGLDADPEKGRKDVGESPAEPADGRESADPSAAGAGESAAAKPEPIVPEPRSHEEMVALAEQHVRAGETDQAGKYLLVAAEGLREERAWQDAAHAYRRLAEIGEAKGEDFEDWIECARQAGRASEVLEALSTAARWHLKQGDVPAARRFAEEMFLVDPDSETATEILERIGSPPSE